MLEPMSRKIIEKELRGKALLLSKRMARKTGFGH